MNAPDSGLDFGGPVDVPFERWCGGELPGGVVPRFQQIAARFPNRLAVTDREGEWTYAELAHIAGGVQRSLNASGEPVAIEIPNSRWLVAAMLGALAAGRPYVPVDPSHPASRNRRIREHSGADFTISRGWIEGLRGAAVESGAAGRNIACILYTSGSTGQPKGVYQNQRNLMHDVMQYTHSVHISPEDRLTLLYSGGTVGAVRDIFGALLNGASLHIHDLRSEGMGRLHNQLHEGLISIYHSVPPVFRALAPSPGRFPARVRLVYLAGDRVLPGDFELFAGRFADESLLYTGIGCTECWTIYRQWFLRPGMAISGPLLPVGRAIPDRAMQLLEDGEIAVTSRYLALGYWRDPELTAARFTVCPADPDVRTFRTGDRGREREDGLLEYLGRADQQVKVRGYRVELAEIESAMLPATAAVTLHEGSLTAVYEGPRLSGWPEKLAAKLPAYMIPARFVWVEKLPTLANHKLDRAAIATLARDSAPVAQGETETPGGELELAIRRAFADVLGLSTVPPDGDFFALGGDSLRLLQLSSRLERLSGRAAAVNPLQSARTPRALALYLSTPTDAAEPELYYLPGLDGGLASLDALLPALPSPVQALRYPADLSLKTIPAIAAWLRQSLPPRSAPYRLLGYSFGGRVGFELARQLTAAGAKVDFLGIIDTPATGELARRPFLARLGALLRTARHPGQWLAVCRHRARRRTLVRSPLLRRNREAFNTYAPQPWDGEITLVRCSGELLGWDPADNFLGWDGFCQRVVVHRFEGTHNIRDPLVTPSLIKVLAAAIPDPRTAR